MKLRSLFRRSRSRGLWSRVAVITVVVAIVVPAIAALMITGTRSSRLDERSRAAAEAAVARVVLSDAAGQSVRHAVYRYSVVPGGVQDASDAMQAAARDRVVAQHYAGVDLAGMRGEVLERDRLAYVSYRKGDRIYWTNRRVVIPAGETILSNGTNAIRARCGNLLSAVPMKPTSKTDPRELDLVDVPRELASSTSGSAPLTGTHLGIPVPAASGEGDPGSRRLFGGGFGLIGGYSGSAASESQSGSSSQTLELLSLPNPSVTNRGGERSSPDFAITEVLGDSESDETPSEPVSVPEPATWLLFGSGIAASFAARRRSLRRD